MYIRQKYRIYPNKKQEQVLINWFGQARFVWNHMLSLNKETYEMNKKFIFKNKMITMIPSLKKEHPWIKDVPAQVLQGKCRDLDKALKGCFRHHKGFPKFKSKHTDISGISFPQKWKITDKLYLPKMKKGIKIKIDRELLDTGKTCTVYRTKAGQWFASIVVQLKDDYFPTPVEEITNSVGIDVGIKEFAVTSDGDVIPNPTFLKKSLKKLKKLQRAHSKSKKGSKNRNKKRIKLARCHNKIANQRKDFIKKIANSITKNNDLICIEDLNIEGMKKNHKLAQSISDVSWSMFFTELKWQAIKHGSHISVIGKFFPSSKTCSSCGHKKEELSLGERTYKCDSCDYIEDRDLNAAINILNEGTRLHLEKDTAGTAEIYACADMNSDGKSGQETYCYYDDK